MSKKTNEVMDPSIREDKVPVPTSNTARVCWAARTLCAEVGELFPETDFEYSNYDGRNTALDVTIDLSMMEPADVHDATLLLTLLADPAYNNDTRIREVLADTEEKQVLVGFVSNPRTQDSRAPFGLADALLVLAGEDEQ